MEILIGPTVYDVCFEPAVRDDDGEECYGLHVHPRSQVLVLDALGKQEQLVTIWHEVFHILLVQAGLDGDHNERELTALSYGILQVMRDNPHLLPRGEK